jgi:putative oxidoreductase
VIRRFARALLGAAFISTGLEALKGIDRRAMRAESYGVPEPATAARAAAITQIGTGTLLMLNKLPRLTALVAAIAVIPEAATGHDFWTEKDSDAKQAQRALFARDLGLLGGLLVTTVDSGGRESVPHRAARRSRSAARTSRSAARSAAKSAAKKVPVGA